MKTKKGKILKAKLGVNPNSSSMGSIVFALRTSLLAVTALFGIVAGVICAVFVGRRREQDTDEDQGS